MLRRILSLILLIWAVGFVWFAGALPQPAGAEQTDGVVVLTGGEGRIDRGLQALRNGWAVQMLVSGVDHSVKPREFAVKYKVSPGHLACCITLGYESTDTASNAAETARWVKRLDLGSIRLVTTDWHMRRAAYEVRMALPTKVRIIEDAVPSQPSLRILVLEYHKFLARRLWWG